LCESETSPTTLRRRNSFLPVASANRYTMRYRVCKHPEWVLSKCNCTLPAKSYESRHGQSCFGLFFTHETFGPGKPVGPHNALSQSGPMFPCCCGGEPGPAAVLKQIAKKKNEKNDKIRKIPSVKLVKEKMHSSPWCGHKRAHRSSWHGERSL